MKKLEGKNGSENINMVEFRTQADLAAETGNPVWGGEACGGVEITRSWWLLDIPQHADIVDIHAWQRSRIKAF